MKIEEYANFQEAIESLTKKDKNYAFVRHTLNVGEMIKLHYHPKANEFLVTDNGVFTVELGREHKPLRPGGRVIVIHFPRGRKHGLWALALTSYFVFRDKEDETIYCEEVKE